MSKETATTQRKRSYLILFAAMAVVVVAGSVFSGLFSFGQADKTNDAVARLLRGRHAIARLKNTGSYAGLRRAFIAADYAAETGGSGLVAKNNANEMRATFSDAGLQLASADASWISNWSLQSLGYGADQKAVAKGELRSSGTRVDLARDGQGLTEWFENSPNGIEHGFTLAARPAVKTGDAELRLVIAVAGDLTPTADEDGQALTLAKLNGETALRYEKLKIWDAEGKARTAHMQTNSDGQVLIDVDESDAVYPLTIDPLFYNPAKISAADGVAEDQFAGSLAISGDTAIVGASAIGAANHRPGAAYFFVGGGNSWTLQQKITAFDAVNEDQFGFDVAIDGQTAVVGAFGRTVGVNPNQGAVYVYTKINGFWTFQQQLFASDGAKYDIFGSKVAISGDTIVVGANGVDTAQTDNQGAAYVFFRTGTTWAQQQKLTASDAKNNAFFGDSVAIGADTIVVGATEDTVGTNTQQGSAYVFLRSGSTWSQQQKLTASDGASGDGFGYRVGVSVDTAIVGAPQNIIGNSPGAAYVFVRTGTVWAQQQKLTADDGAAGDAFGISVTLSGNTAIVGADGDTIGSNVAQGSAYLYTRTGSVWTQRQKFTSSDGAAGDNFGISVAANSDSALIGSYASTIGGNIFQGAFYAYSPNVTITGRVTTPDGLNLRSASVTITDPFGVRRSVLTNNFGIYTFSGVRSGDRYTISVTSKKYRFAVRSLQVDANTSGVDFTGLE